MANESNGPLDTVIDSAVADADLAKYGITRVPADYFYVGAFRYTALPDAVAEAKRRLAAV